MTALTMRQTSAQTVTFVPPASPRTTLNFNPGWKFLRQDVTGAEAPDFDDSRWETVSTPHTYNDTDSYDEIINHNHGEDHQYMGVAWYRKHFKLPATAQEGKVFLEFEGLKQAGRFFVNGQAVGKHENGITPCGLDLTPFVKFGAQDNVLAVKVDNSDNYAEEATGTGFQWMGRAFNPNYGGLNRNIRLHLAGKIYQTLPLYENLQTTGIYIYPENISVEARTCDVTVEAQVKNEADTQPVMLSVVVTDHAGKVCARFQSAETSLAAGETHTFPATGHLANARWWDVNDPFLYDVHTILSSQGKTLDVCKTTAGLRRTAFRGGAGEGGVWLNDRSVYLKGYAQRSTNDWAGLGQAYPDWMHDYNARLIRQSNANYLRWMHIAPQPADVRACDRAGIVQIVPAGDKEKDAEGRQWEQRLEVMRDSIIYLRNHPSILFWEAGNNGISAEHLRQMVELRKQWDPHGGRAMGCRSLTDPDTADLAEYFGVMVGQDARTDALKTPDAMFRAYSARRRDRAPFLEAEDFRDEAARRFWDDFSPPHFGFKPGPKDAYRWNSETFCLAAIRRYHEYYVNRIGNSDPAHARWAGYASIYWSDSNADGRQQSSEVCRVSGKVDSVRLPKEAFYAYRVMQSERPDLHIIGHWTYPANTRKNVYVVSNCEEVELFVNDVAVGRAKPTDGYLFTFADVEWKPGRLRAAGFAKGKQKAGHTVETVGAPAALKLTPVTGPGGWQADGADVALVDVEVVDGEGRRCPTDEGRVDFKLEGPAVWRGGYNSGIPGSTNRLFLNTECGINRVAIRSTFRSGGVTLTATRAGLRPAEARLEARPTE